MAAQANSYKRSAPSSQSEVRTLVNLGETASTSRILNLALIYAQHARDPLYQDYPFFKHSQLNKALIVKHTLRDGERDLFVRPRRTATKIILPFDPVDLRLGGRSIFVNQIGFEGFTRSYFNIDDPAALDDIEKLRALDTIPALDPFLVREQMARFGHRPAPCYFQISPRDLADMMRFTNDEIQRLVSSAFTIDAGPAAMKLTTKILSNILDSDLDPLRDTLRMSEEDFAESMFSWRGFLYFRWRQSVLQEEVRQVVLGLTKYRTLGVIDADTKAYLVEARPRLAKKIIAAMGAARQTLAIYEAAYAALTEKSDPAPFRRFLLEGPSLFYDLGEQMGTLSHIATFWAYRMGTEMAHIPLSPLDFADTLIDFEDSLVKLGRTGRVPPSLVTQPEMLL